MEKDFNGFAEIFREIKRITGRKNQKDVGLALGITGAAVTDAKNRNTIPESWFDKIEELYQIRREDVIKRAISGSINSPPYKPEKNDQNMESISAEKLLPLVRNYRKLEEMDADTLGEIQTWINDMERFRPGFTSWFRLEFQNRFPEFDDWKNRMVKKRTGTGN